MKPIQAKDIQESLKKTNYPEPFASLFKGRTKRKLGDHFQLTNFGVNLTTLLPNSVSALFHQHERQDEFIYIIEGTPTLRYGSQEFLMNPGDCFGFKKGTEVAHQLVNKTELPVTYLEIGDRTEGDTVTYPNDDIQAEMDVEGKWRFVHKNGSPY